MVLQESGLNACMFLLWKRRRLPLMWNQYWNINELIWWQDILYPYVLGLFLKDCMTSPFSKDLVIPEYNFNYPLREWYLLCDLRILALKALPTHGCSPCPVLMTAVDLHAGDITLWNNHCLCFFADSPRRLWWYHWLCWALSMVGMFCILLAHDHYTVDVVVAYYITTRLFWWYHTMANQQVSFSQSLDSRGCACCSVVVDEYPHFPLSLSGGVGVDSSVYRETSLSYPPSHWVCRKERGVIGWVHLAYCLQKCLKIYLQTGLCASAA